MEARVLTADEKPLTDFLNVHFNGDGSGSFTMPKGTYGGTFLTHSLLILETRNGARSKICVNRSENSRAFFLPGG
jgi:hypothetical protein